jgi:hypothetical protein
MRLRISIVAVLLLSATYARADLFEKVSDAELLPYTWTPESPHTAAELGQRLFSDLRARDARVAASLEEAVRYRLQTEEADKFARQRKYVIAAYAVVWTVLVAFAVGVYLRHRKLEAALSVLEARLRTRA